GDRKVGQELQQERLELVIGAVDLVDQQDDGFVRARFQGVEQRPAQQEAAREQLTLVDASLGGAERQQLAGVIPVVDGVVDVDPLVALEADQPCVGRRGERPRDLGLPHSGLALEQQRLVEGDREVDGQRQRTTGQITLGGERFARLLY